LNERILGAETVVRVYLYTYWTATPGSTPQRVAEPKMGDLEFQILGVENANEKGDSRFGCLKKNVVFNVEHRRFEGGAWLLKNAVPNSGC
jgi:hypothetical protein